MALRTVLLALTATILFTSCGTCPSMDCCVFDSISVGDPIEEVLACAGTPRCIKYCDDGTRQYVYVTRHDMGLNTKVHRRFFLTVDGGIVTDKSCDEEDYTDLYFHMDPYTTY